MKKIKTSQSKAPIEIVIPLLDPVRIYTALELKDMPLSVMNAAIEAQEKYFLLETTTQMGGQAIVVRRLMQEGVHLIQVREKSRTRYKINNEFVEPRIIRQLEKRGLVNLGGVK
ncbi:hypothetical protein RFI36_04810 [Acinetobacter gerneri]|uniref:Uncharacterized protein n=1 Tax=Acinetobacter gerneri TaxID=202952 RepID=A0AAW8JGZ9_9GAMM|nr:hypothetical protein [Acinetobacter gerneri]MDQ9009010.1 hypothetical protein [Acinetobacter gerneri]MDQ9013114.1 hypothetical protein [Acinetobacter gerneri]MDQ9024551.1 hypothetical protein [Acinetobacter gerneri]MDQ9051786.1 hypothetical protein [Acinetobacter gerneri]MDQ9059234.1 hypothetical protein [Acinetobacter gerneri]